ncbi:MAG TPA: crossover junction endodeoxyribonuclease RuvC [Gammaproteobacteria bacterium]|jgi:crossover junction endodeoxyribonuclease RuvC|nr:crossover junction endodeoxyribonuclease RuvC [Gammaproteobacteria bacterium]
MHLIILGIDPGSRVTGYGVIRMEGNQSMYVTCGCIRTMTLQGAERLQQIFHELQQVVQEYQPIEAAIEQVFMHQNPSSALKLGQARGAAMAAVTIPIAEYSARQVKQSIVGFGAAKKEQVQHMVQRLLSINEKLQADAADALAIALCHAHMRLAPYQLISAKRRKKNSWRNYSEIK